MQPKASTKKLTLRKEMLRRLPRELTERQLARALGGDDGGAYPIIIDTDPNNNVR